MAMIGKPRPAPRPMPSFSASVNPGLAADAAEEVAAELGDVVGKAPVSILDVVAACRCGLVLTRNSSLVQVPVLFESCASQ